MSSPSGAPRTGVYGEVPFSLEQAVPAPLVKQAATYLPAFDWLRITLASFVMVAHTDLRPWEHLGDFCVQVFFALSGWLIGRILYATPRASLPRFYFGRVVRIWIPYTLALVLLLGLAVVRDPITPKWLEFVFYKVTFVYNLFGTPQLAEHMAEMPLHGTANHFWSICAEEQFYLFAPLLIVLMPSKLGRSPITWVALAAGGIFNSVMLGFSAIALGVAASLAHARWGAFHLKPAVRAGLAVVLVASIAAMVTNDANYNHAAPPLALSIVLLLATPGKKNDVGAFLGGMSYPLYLNHWIGLFIAHAAAKRFGISDDLAILFVGFPLALALCAVLYVMVDKRTMANREHWFTPGRAKVAMVVAYSTTTLGLIGGLSMALRH